MAGDLGVACGGGAPGVEQAEPVVPRAARALADARRRSSSARRRAAAAAGRVSGRRWSWPRRGVGRRHSARRSCPSGSGRLACGPCRSSSRSSPGTDRDPDPRSRPPTVAGTNRRPRGGAPLPPLGRWRGHRDGGVARGGAVADDTPGSAEPGLRAPGRAPGRGAAGRRRSAAGRRWRSDGRPAARRWRRAARRRAAAGARRASPRSSAARARSGIGRGHAGGWRRRSSVAQDGQGRGRAELALEQHVELGQGQGAEQERLVGPRRTRRPPRRG